MEISCVFRILIFSRPTSKNLLFHPIIVILQSLEEFFSLQVRHDNNNNDLVLSLVYCSK
jgi:hypothetical protein